MVRRSQSKGGLRVRIAFINQDRGIGPDREKGAAVHLRALRQALVQEGAQVLAFDEHDDRRLLDALHTAWNQEPFDLVYERFALGKDAACKFAIDHNVPFALEVNAPLLEEAATWREHQVCDHDRLCESLLMRHADTIFAVSSRLKSYAQERGARHVEVCPNGVDTRVFYPRQPNPLRSQWKLDERLVIGFHGRLRPWHGIERLAGAVKRLIHENYPIHVMTVGRGDYEELLAAYIPPSHRTHFQWVPHDQVAAYVACFDVLPLCYSGPVYFSPLKLAEGMAVGAVPIVPRGGDWEQFLFHEQNALYYETGDEQDLANCIEQLILQPNQRHSLSKQAVITAGELSWRAIAKRVLSVGSEASCEYGGPS